MPLKLIPPKAGRNPVYRVRGTHLGIYVDRTTGVADERKARKLLIKWRDEIESGQFRPPHPSGRALMPIRPENRARYPKDWPLISHRIRERASHRCEQCGVANHALGGRSTDGTFLPAQPTGTDGIRVTWPRPGEHAWCGRGDRAEHLRIIRIVLTVAHLDHTPENCADANLRCWCQRCHNLYDAAARRAGTRERAKALRATGDLLSATEVA